MYVHMYVHIYVHMYVHMYVHSVCMYVCIYILCITSNLSSCSVIYMLYHNKATLKTVSSSTLVLAYAWNS